MCISQLISDSRMKNGNEINLGLSDSTTAAADFKYSIQDKVISVTFFGPGSIHEGSGEYCGRSSIGTRARLSPSGSFTRTLTGWAARSSGTERTLKLSLPATHRRDVSLKREKQSIGADG
jgi:hypothetical protein